MRSEGERIEIKKKKSKTTIGKLNAENVSFGDNEPIGVETTRPQRERQDTENRTKSTEVFPNKTPQPTQGERVVSSESVSFGQNSSANLELGRKKKKNRST